ncbi:T9SS type A sorting domain-containing protein [Polluticaenibacter yanchengensis]|uniref:T9SS type A sorting domain-containing protein n=1 Tax=Polluticaenibacter yanchengensis TaxID=3014562 RepID=A0ABT4UQ64_9BACT|nr:T9SS type A sorting domain-containing protein [Chitinophagaceae bacterium LY-5]
MKKTFTLLSALFLTGAAFAQNFTAGNFIVMRIGDGAAAPANTGALAFLDEYTFTGTLVQSVAIPGTTNGANKGLIINGTATADGMISRSANGKYVAFAGYNTKGATISGAISSTTATDVPRVVGSISYNKTINTSIEVTDFASGANIRSAYTPNGTDFYMVGSNSGVGYRTPSHDTTVRISSASTVVNLRTVGVFDNQLYITTSSGTENRLSSVGTGMPTTNGNTIASLPGLPVTGVTLNQVVFFDLSTTEPGVDVLYTADETTGSTGGVPNAKILKYSKVNGTWVANGSIGTTNVCYGITGKLAGGKVQLVASRNSANLIFLEDASGYNATITGDISVIATAANNTRFRGVALTPEEEVLPVGMINFTASKTLGNNVLSFTTTNEVDVIRYEVQRSSDGISYSTIGSINARNQPNNEYSFTDVSASGNVYYRIKIVNKDGSIKYSRIANLSDITRTDFTVSPNPAKSNLTITHTAIKNKGVANLFANDGRLVASFNLAPNATQTNLDISNIANGTYRLVVIDGTTKTSKLFIKQ